ncbi:condensation protein (plasmid) [Streptomyces clavuligerus]|uniref:Condensation domain protein n=1 Tax=Streptomyces clavuligerus TaxID=1901 RepID=D5SJV5_STRCL|nr:condensation protein [Streptomyces clavuligerus]EFG04198.1 Condensation domain protein [Streptomyces clavuligerus]
MAERSSVRPRPTAIRTVTVAYTGGEARRGPVTMGQANMIRCILRDEPTHINIHDVWPVPAGTRVEAAVDALRALAVRHEALRTTFPGPAGAVPREQTVATGGEFTVTVLNHDALPDDAAAYAESVARHSRAGRFRLDRDFPLRISLIALDGMPLFVALASSHAVTDGSALAVLREEWTTLLAEGTLPPLDMLTPLDLAAEETSPAGLRKSDASLRHWERILRTGPQAMFAEPGAEGTDTRQPGLVLRSRRGARALALVARRTGALPSTVLLTAWCTLVAHRTGQPSCVAAVPTSNRFLPQMSRSVNTLSQDALLLLDVREDSFDALLRKAWGAALNAYRHSRFDSLALWDMIGRTTWERGSAFARDVVFNDVSLLPSTLASATTDETEDPELEVGPGPEQVLPTRLLTFVYRTEPTLHLGVWADPALLPRSEAEAFLTGLVRLLEAAGAADVPLAALTEVTGVRPVERGSDWARVDGCWVSPRGVADALSTALGGRPAHVALDAPGTEAGGLTAYIAAGGSPLTPEQAHAALMDMLPGRPGLLAPRRYVIVQDPPPEQEQEQDREREQESGRGQRSEDGGWAGQPVLSEGDGRERKPESGTGTEAEAGTEAGAGAGTGTAAGSGAAGTADLA